MFRARHAFRAADHGDDVVRDAHPGYRCAAAVLGWSSTCRASEAGRDAALVQIALDLPIGVANGCSWHSSEVVLVAGAVLCVYSNGLVERPGVVIDDNIDKLRTAVAAQSAESGACRGDAADDQTHDPEDGVVARRFVQALPLRPSRCRPPREQFVDPPRGLTLPEGW
jgi:hypothetical protein